MASGKGFGKAINSINKIQDSLQAIAKLKSGRSVLRGEFDVDISTIVSKIKDTIKDVKAQPERIQEAHHLAMEQVAIELKDALDAAMEATIWQWTDDTRDIIDTGALKNSGKVTYNRSSQNINIIYGEEYAGIVHYGGEIGSGYNPSVRIFYPARPWITSTLKGQNGVEKFPLASIYLKNFKKFLK